MCACQPSEPRMTCLTGRVTGGLDRVDPGSSFSTVATSIGDELVALEVVAFPPSIRGVGEGHYAWGRIPDTSCTAPRPPTGLPISHVQQPSVAQMSSRWKSGHNSNTDELLPGGSGGRSVDAGILNSGFRQPSAQRNPNCANYPKRVPDGIDAKSYVRASPPGRSCTNRSD